MSRTIRFLNGVALGYMNQILVMVVGLWLTPFLLARLGVHDYGVWIVGLQVLTYLTLADIGVVGLLPREVAYATGRAGMFSRSEELPGILGRTIRVVLCQTVLLALAELILLLF